MEKNSLDRVKLMMGYDLSKTLNENTSEMGIKGDVEEAGFKSVEKAMKSGTDLKKLYAELGTAFKVSEDVVRLAAAKDLTTLTKELKSAVTKDLKSGFRSGGSSLGSLTKNASKSKTIHEILNAGKPLNENEIIAIIERNKSQAKDLIVKAEQGGKTVSKTASTTTKTVAKDVAAAEKEVKAAVVDVKTSVEASKVIDQTVVAVTKKGPRLAARLRKAKMTISKYSPKFWGKLSSVRSKLSLKNLLLFGLAGYGLYELMKGWFTDGEDGGGETGGVFPPCVTNLDDYKIVTTSNGDPVIVAFNPGEQTEVKFYTNGRVWTKSNDKKGRYSCKSDTELNEQPDSVMDRRIGIDTPSTNNKNTSKVSTNNFSNISIVWDGDKVNPSPDPDVTPVPSPPKKSMYKPCADFPFAFGCISERVTEVQRCLAISDDGKFGPNTLKAITNHIMDSTKPVGNDINGADVVIQNERLSKLKSEGITKELYDQILAKCKTENKPVIKTGNTQTTTTGTTKTDTTKTIPTEPTVKSTETTKGETPADLYARLVKDGSLRGRLRGQRIVYKGPDLSKEEQEKLGQYMADQGYRLSRSNFDKKFGDKYVYKKNKPEEETK
jgi:hypothetical protein